MAPQVSRREFIQRGTVAVSGVMAAGALAGCGDSGSAPTASASAPPVTTGAEALRRLVEGNGRFTSGQLAHPRRDDVRRAEVAEEQAPYAVILGCADSRVPPEVIFDEGVGDLFLVRVAGNTAADPAILGSIEYAAEVLHSLLVMVLGHDGCGAVKAALDVVKTGRASPGHLPAFIDPIVPAARATKTSSDEAWLTATIRENVRRTVAQLTTSTPILAPLVTAGRLTIVGAEYHLTSGAVSLIS